MVSWEIWAIFIFIIIAAAMMFWEKKIRLLNVTIIVFATLAVVADYFFWNTYPVFVFYFRISCSAIILLIAIFSLFKVLKKNK